MKIGITIGLQSDYESIWINGIKLNALLLANALMKIGKYEVVILDTSRKVTDLSKVSWDVNKFPIEDYWKVYPTVDILITLGTSFPTEILDQFRKSGPNKKVVKYMCGNSYVIDMERSIFKEGNDLGKAPWDPGADQLWYVPQQGYQNHEYYKVAFRNENVFPVPFVWDPMFLDIEVLRARIKKTKTPYYIPGKENSEKLLSVFEPNLNVVKYAMIPIMIAEKALREGVEFKKMNVASGQRLLKNGYFKSMIATMDIVNGSQGPKISFTSRYPVTHYLANGADVIVSHQWENPLNYSYLDVMYFGFPLVHNADMIKDAGYYYSDFNVNEGYNQLKYAIEEHDNNLEEYKLRNQKVLDRYTVKNQDLLDTYEKLIENLFEKDKHQLSYNYNWQTNTYF
jgi:hypothetical protein